MNNAVKVFSFLALFVVASFFSFISAQEPLAPQEEDTYVPRPPYYLPDAREGERWEYTVAPKGMVPPVRFEWGGKRPKGINPDQDYPNMIGGTPLDWSPKPYEFFVTVTDAPGRNVLRQDYVLYVRPKIPELRIATDSIPTFVKNREVRFEIVATGGEGSYVWHYDPSRNILPRDLQLGRGEDPARLFITGIPKNAGRIDIKVVVEDEMGRKVPEKTLVGQVSSGVAPPLDIVNRSMGGYTRDSVVTIAPAYLGQPYHERLVAEGGQPPYTWNVKWIEKKPEWLTFDPETGIMKGVPDEMTTYFFNAYVSDSSFGENGVKSTTQQTGRTELVVGPPVGLSDYFGIGTSVLPSGRTDETYVAYIEAMVPVGEVEWDWDKKKKPTWVNFSSEGNRLKISGRPGSKDDYEVKVIAKNINVPDEEGKVRHGIAKTVSRIYSIHIEAKKDEIEVITKTVPDAIFGEDYSVIISARGGKLPLEFVGSSKSWANFNKGNGEIWGTPDKLGKLELDFYVQDSEGMKSDENSITVRVVEKNKKGVRVLPFEDPIGLEGKLFVYQLPIDGRSNNISISGLPPGLTFFSEDYRIRGVPLEAGDFPVTVSIADADGNGVVKSSDFQIHILDQVATSEGIARESERLFMGIGWYGVVFLLIATGAIIRVVMLQKRLGAVSEKKESRLRIPRT